MRGMSVFDLKCDRCGVELAGPGDDDEPDGPFGIRFLYHPGDVSLKDQSGLFCQACWTGARRWLGEIQPGRCSRCGDPVEYSRSLHVGRTGDTTGWQLCRTHAVAFLNQLRTVEPKLDVESFTLAGDWHLGAGRAPGATRIPVIGVDRPTAE